MQEMKESSCTALLVVASIKGLEESNLAGVVQQMPTSWNTPLLSRSVAGGLNTACVAQAYTSLAPCVCRTCRQGQASCC